MSAEHRHAAFEVAAQYTDPPGSSVDRGLMGRFIGAAYDRCASCQEILLTLMVDDVPTVVGLLELACVAIHHPFGWMPMKMVDEQAAGLAAADLRRLTCAGMVGANAAMRDECERMTLAERRAAAKAAADFLIDQLA